LLTPESQNTLENDVRSSKHSVRRKEKYHTRMKFYPKQQWPIRQADSGIVVFLIWEKADHGKSISPMAQKI
jgi:hypothetical protein